MSHHNCQQWLSQRWNVPHIIYICDLNTSTASSSSQPHVLYIRIVVVIGATAGVAAAITIYIYYYTAYMAIGDNGPDIYLPVKSGTRLALSLHTKTHANKCLLLLLTLRCLRRSRRTHNCTHIRMCARHRAPWHGIIVHQSVFDKYFRLISHVWRTPHTTDWMTGLSDTAAGITYTYT